MFLHDLKYELLTILRTKALVFWLVIFPIALGSFFKLAFTGIYEKTTKFSSVPAAVVMEKQDETFKATIDSVSEGDDALLDVTYIDSVDEAEKLLLDGEIEGILIKGDTLTLTVAGEGMNETILKAFTDRYLLSEAIITDAFTNGGPEKGAEAAKALSQEVSAVSDIEMTKGNTDNLAQYYYNLLAMVALYGACSV